MMPGVMKLEAVVDPDNLRPKAAAILRVYLDNYTLLRKELELLWEKVQDMPSQLAAYQEQAAALTAQVAAAEATARRIADMGAAIVPLLPDWAHAVPGLTPKHLTLLQQWVSEAEGGTPTDPKVWNIVYQASKQDWGSLPDRAYCNPRILYLIVEKERGWLFGGYASQGYTKTARDWIDDRKAFVFTLTNPHGIAPFKTMAQTEHAYDFYRSMDFCAFGDQPQPRLTVSKYKTREGSFGISATYPDPTGMGETLFTGSKKYLCADFFVFTNA
jgi:hypothetical protein